MEQVQIWLEEVKVLFFQVFTEILTPVVKNDVNESSESESER